MQIDSEDEEFGGVHGFSRVRSALSAHTWSNLVMKSGSTRRLRSEDDADDSAAVEAAEDTSPVQEPVGDSNPQNASASGQELEDRDVDVFEQLFSRLHQFKSTAEGLSGEERRTYAEQVHNMFF